MEAKEFLLKHKVLILLSLILVFSFGLRLYFGSLDQIPVWYDEGSYLTYAKEIGMNIDIDPGWNPRRPFLLPVLWGGFYFFGANETVLRFTILLFSLFGVLLTFKLGKEMFDENVGLLAAAFSSFFWLDLFFTGRLLTDVPSAVLMLAGYYFFYKGYIKKLGNKFVYLGFAFLGLAVFTRAALLLSFVPLGVLVLLRERHKIFVNKQLWIGLLVVVLVLSPFVIWLFSNFSHPVEAFTGIGEGRFTVKEFHPFHDIWNFVSQFPRYLELPLLILFVVGFFWWLFDIVLGYDLLFKDHSLQKKVFLLSWILTFLLFYSLGAAVPEDRYLLPIFAAVFIIGSVMLMKLVKVVRDNQKWLVIPLIGIVLIASFGLQFVEAKNIIIPKQGSYSQVKDAGLWLKDNSVLGDRIISQSKPQISYYSERLSQGFAENVSSFESQLKKFKPKFVMISVFENHPEYAYSYFQEHNDSFVPVHAITTEDNQPLVVIFEYVPNE